jgi:tRNA1(Val) A37 N6-methylase TrmN6
MTAAGHLGPSTEPAAPAQVEVTDDAFLGDRLQILQPRTGYRAGIDAVLLAASVAGNPSEALTVLDCGAGVGTVGLCIATRFPQARVTLVEREPALVELAQRNIRRNRLEPRVCVVAGDVTAPALKVEAPPLPLESFDHVLANPPYHDTGDGTDAGDPLKRASHAMHPGALDDWVRFAARMVRPRGRFTLIHKADALPVLLASLQDRFGALGLTPIHPYTDKPAIRVLVTGVKGSKAPLTLNPPLVLHGASGDFTPYVGQILRQGAPLVPPHEPKD